MSCSTKQACDCEDIECRLKALEDNQTELEQRTRDLADMVEELSPVIIAFVADAGTAGDQQDAMMELINGWSPKYLILGGDNNYPDGDEATADANLLAFKDYIDSERCFPVIGNHDEGEFPIPVPNNYLYSRFPYVFDPLRTPKYSIPIPEKDAELFFFYSGMYSDGTVSPYGIGEVGGEVVSAQSMLSGSTMSQKLAFMHHTFCGPDIDGGSNRYLDTLNLVSWRSGGVKGLFSGHTHTAWHLKGVSGDMDGLNLIECSATTQTPRGFVTPVSLIGSNTADFDVQWMYDEETRYAIKINLYKTYYRVEFWSFQGDVHHAFNVYP